MLATASFPIGENKIPMDVLREANMYISKGFALPGMPHILDLSFNVAFGLKSEDNFIIKIVAKQVSLEDTRVDEDSAELHICDRTPETYGERTRYVDPLVCAIKFDRLSRDVTEITTHATLERFDLFMKRALIAGQWLEDLLLRIPRDKILIDGTRNLHAL